MKTTTASLLLAAALAAPALAQQASPPQQPQPRALPSPAVYQQAARILQGAPSAAPPVKVKRKLRPAPRIEGAITGGAIEVERQTPLPANARMALTLSGKWLNSGPMPIEDAPGGRVLYVYGQGVPTVVCAILQVCELDLEAGETVVKDALDWGDHRFEVVTRTAGSAQGQFTYLVLKPTQPGLDTTMTVGTNKRPYYVRLISTSGEHMARVAFTYPGEEQEKREAEAAAQGVEEKRRKAEAERLATLNTAKPIRNWNYRVKLHGKDAAYLRPESIGDDGTHTYIQLSETARHRGLPAVQLKDARGPIPANARWDGNRLVVDALFEHACLLEGVGKAQQRACIANHGLRTGGTNGSARH